MNYGYKYVEIYKMFTNPCRTLKHRACATNCKIYAIQYVQVRTNKDSKQHK